MKNNMSNWSKKASWSFGQINCLNGMKIKDDIANYMRLYVRTVLSLFRRLWVNGANMKKKWSVRSSVLK